MGRLTFADAQAIGFDLLAKWLDAYRANDFKRCKKIVKELKSLDALVDKPRK